MTSRLIVDRIENDVVICQDMDGNEAALSVSQTDNVREGDVIVLTAECTEQIRIRQNSAEKK